MTATTSHFVRRRVDIDVDEIVVPSRWRDRIEAVAGDRRRTLVWGVAVAALLVGLALYPQVDGPEPVVAAPATSSGTSAERSHTSAPEVFVHVAGAVVKPGLYRFPDGTRVADAVEAAGGPLPRANLDAINLAQVLTDGIRIEIPRKGSVATMVPSTSASPGLVDLNSADQTALETIPGVGPVTAAAILQHRTEIGRFESVEQLLDVSGIGPATLEALRSYVTV